MSTKPGHGPAVGKASVSEQAAQRAEAVREAGTENFCELLTLSCLEPKQHLRFADWSGVSFRGCDLRGFDFTGARLHNCDFNGALIDGARFDQAEIRGANLRAAKDWAAHVSNWRRREPDLNAERSLWFFEPFQDAPFAPELVIVPAGEFMMGTAADETEALIKEYGKEYGTWARAENPRHEVTIPQPFAIGRYAVTFDEWDAAQADKDWQKITKLKPYEPEDQGWGRGRRPVINVSWKDAQGYAKWLSVKTGRQYRLPGEAEWEYAARAGTQTPFWWGPSISTDQANYDGNSTFGGGKKGEYRKKTVPVDQFQPNPFDLYQVHGNVWEWCEDWWHDSYKDKPSALLQNGGAWTTGGSSRRVLRGGSWVNLPGILRAAGRVRGASGIRVSRAGFRLARTLNL